VVVKRGALGAVAIDHGKRHEQRPITVQPIDAVGAGDSFNAGFLHAYLRGWSIEKCLRMGNLTGAYSTTRIGGITAFRDKKLMEQFFSAHAPGLYSRA
jgi:sugar/nucleoside kinase (ribokinase family)